MQQDTRTIIKKKCFLSNILKTHLDKKKKRFEKLNIFGIFFYLNEQSVNFELATTEIN